MSFAKVECGESGEFGGDESELLGQSHGVAFDEVGDFVEAAVGELGEDEVVELAR